MGSNQTVKRRVGEGRVCFVCEQRVPQLYVDEFAGWMCSLCYTDLGNMRLSYALEGGYVMHVDKRKKQ